MTLTNIRFADAEHTTILAERDGVAFSVPYEAVEQQLRDPQTDELTGETIMTSGNRDMMEILDATLNADPPVEIAEYEEPEVIEPPLDLKRVASAQLSVYDWEVTGIERSIGLAGAFVVDVDSIWVLFDTEYPDADFIIMPEVAGLTKFADHLEITQPGLSELKFLVYRVQ